MRDLPFGLLRKKPLKKFKKIEENKMNNEKICPFLKGQECPRIGCMLFSETLAACQIGVGVYNLFKLANSLDKLVKGLPVK